MEGQEVAPLNLQASEFLPQGMPGNQQLPRKRFDRADDVIEAAAQDGSQPGQHPLQLQTEEQERQQQQLQLQQKMQMAHLLQQQQQQQGQNPTAPKVEKPLCPECNKRHKPRTSPCFSSDPPCPGCKRRHPTPCTAVCEECGATNHSRFGCPFANARQRQHSTRSERSAAWRGRGRGGQWRGQSQNPAPQQRRSRQETSGPLVGLANADAAYAFGRDLAGHGRRRSRSTNRGQISLPFRQRECRERKGQRKGGWG